MAITNLSKRIQLIDGFDLGLPERTGSYVIQEQEVTIVETGPSPSVAYVKAGLEGLGIPLERVRYIIVTHIHLDHAGGAGLLLQDCPNATLVVHQKGARHLSDPARLIAGAKAVYGERFDALFDPIRAVPSERILIKGEGDELWIGPSCTLEFWDAPGHAFHHLGIYDPVSNGLFAGDTAGIRYAQLAEHGIDFYLPSTSPTQFDPLLMKQSIERMARKRLSMVYFGHFGATERVEAALEQTLDWLDRFVEQGALAFGAEESSDQLAERLQVLVQAELAELGVKKDDNVMPYIDMDLQVSAQGLLDYFIKKSEREQGLVERSH